METLALINPAALASLLNSAVSRCWAMVPQLDFASLSILACLSAMVAFSAGVQLVLRQIEPNLEES
ncbi:MAG: hypothetical protein ACTS3T_19755 [Almyronema sp.]